MTKISNARKITKFKRSIKAISPVIATLLMIAIAVVASLVAYAWVMGYMGSTTTKTGKSIQIPSVASSGGNIVVYVQNVGQGTVSLTPDGSVYVNDNLQRITSPAGTITIPVGQTVQLTTDATAPPSGEQVKIRIVTTDGTFMQMTGTVSGPGGSGNPTQYTITVTQNANGAIDPATGPVDAGSTPTYTITPTSGFHISTITANGASVAVTTPAGQTYQFAPVSVAGSLTATFTDNTVTQYTITVTQAANGVISPGTGFVDAGSTPAYTIAPVSGYHIVSITTNAGSQPVTAPAGQTYTFPAVSAVGTLTATFAINTGTQYMITVTPTGPGTITPGTGLVNAGSTPTYTITPNGGCHIVSITANGAPVTVTNPDLGQPYTFAAVSDDGTLAATFSTDIVSVTFSTGGSGTGSTIPSGTADYTAGVPNNIVATPAGVSTFSGWSFSGTATFGDAGSASTTVTFSTAGTVTATFAAANQFTITPSAGSGGSITPNTPQTVNFGATPSFTIAATTGYHILDVTVDSVSVLGSLVGGVYTFPAVTANHNIDATFAADAVNYNIVVTQGANGVIDPGTSSYAAGSTPSFTITPDSGYHIASVTTNAGAQALASPYVFPALSADETLTATFAANTPVTITLRPNSPGTTTQLNAQGTGSANWDRVDEVTADGTTTYVRGTGDDAWQTDSYNIPNQALSGTITQVRIYINVQRGSGNSNNGVSAYTVVRLGSGTIAAGTQHDTLPSTWTPYNDVYTSKPSQLGGGSWTWGDIDSLEIGVALRSHDGGTWGGGWAYAQCTQVWVEVTYIPG